MTTIPIFYLVDRNARSEHRETLVACTLGGEDEPRSETFDVGPPFDRVWTQQSLGFRIRINGCEVLIRLRFRAVLLATPRIEAFPTYRRLLAEGLSGGELDACGVQGVGWEQHYNSGPYWGYEEDPFWSFSVAVERAWTIGPWGCYTRLALSSSVRTEPRYLAVWICRDPYSLPRPISYRCGVAEAGGQDEFDLLSQLTDPATASRIRQSPLLTQDPP